MRSPVERPRGSLAIHISIITESPPFAEVFKNVEPKHGRKLIVVVFLDRGLCGGIHSSVRKYTWRLIEEGTPESPIIALGDESKAQLSWLPHPQVAIVYKKFVFAMSYETNTTEVVNEKSNISVDAKHLLPITWSILLLVNLIVPTQLITIGSQFPFSRCKRVVIIISNWFHTRSRLL